MFGFVSKTNLYHSRAMIDVSSGRTVSSELPMCFMIAFLVTSVAICVFVCVSKCAGVAVLCPALYLEGLVLAE